MPPRGALTLALAIVAASAVAARAQTAPWPNAAPQGQAAWPGSPPPPAQAPWPGGAQAAQPAPPAQAPWPAAQPAGPMMPGPGGPPMMGGGGGPTPDQLACMKGFTQYREETEKRGLAAKAAGDAHKVTREEMCKLVNAYSAAEVKWIKFTADNLAKCGIPKEILVQIKTAHSHTEEARTKICSAGPMPGVPAAPSLSDALGTGPLPTQQAEKRKTQAVNLVVREILGGHA